MIIFLKCSLQKIVHWEHLITYVIFSKYDLTSGCEFDCIGEQNAPHFRHFATQISACVASFYNVKSYTNLSLMMNEQKTAIQNFQMNSHRLTYRMLCMHIQIPQTGYVGLTLRNPAVTSAGWMVL